MAISTTRTVRAILLLLAFCPFCPFWLHAQSSRTISGSVTEGGSGEAITGATVALFREGDSTRPVRGGISNRFGFYSIPNVAPGRYRLTARSIGSQPRSHLLVIPENDPPTIADQSDTNQACQLKLSTSASDLRIDICLQPKDVSRREIVVTEKRNSVGEASISTITLDPGLTQQLPSLGGEPDIMRMLQLLPGIKSGSEISSGLYVRGGSPDQNLILLDGVIVYNPSHLGGFLSTFNSDAIRDLKVIKGGFPAEYGGRLSSVVDLTMREGTKEKISGSGGISLLNSRLTVEGPIGQDVTFMVSGRRFYWDLMLLALPDADEVPSYYFYDLNGKVNWRLSESDHLYLSGYFGNDVVGNPPSEEDRFDITWGNATANLRWAHIVSPTFFTNFSAIYTNYQFSSLIEERYSGSGQADAFKSLSGVRDFMLRAEGQWFAGEDHIVKTGVEVTEHRFRADASAELGDFATIDRNPTIINTLDAAFYAQDEWRITPRLNANIGARLYYFNSGDYFRVEPRASLAYAITEDVTAKGAFSMGNQFLHLISRNDITLPTDIWFPSTASVKPAEATQISAGIEATLLDGEYLLTVEGYHKTMENLLEYRDTASFSLDVPLESSFTVGTGEAYGVELFLNKRLGAFTGWIGYTLAWTKRTFPELNRGRTFYSRHDRRHDVSLVLTYRLGESWELGATWVYGTGQAVTMPTGQYMLQASNDPNNFQFTQSDYSERNGYRIPAFHKLDLNFSHKFSWFNLPFTLSLNVYNAYNRRNVFSQYVDREYQYDPVTGQESVKVKIKRTTLFPIIPTVGLSFKF